MGGHNMWVNSLCVGRHRCNSDHPYSFEVDMQDCPAYMSECPCAPLLRWLWDILWPPHIPRESHQVVGRAKSWSRVRPSTGGGSCQPTLTFLTGAPKQTQCFCLLQPPRSFSLLPVPSRPLFHTTSLALSQIPELQKAGERPCCPPEVHSVVWAETVKLASLGKRAHSKGDLREGLQNA